MKRAIVALVLVAAGFAGGVLYTKHRTATPPPETPHPAEKEAGPAQVSRDKSGNVVITLSGKTEAELGLALTNPAPLQLGAELKGYGKVLDPAPLSALMLELATAEAAYTVSSNELVRLKTLEGQGNASARALQTAEAATQHDRVAVQSCRDRLALNWGPAVANQKELPALVSSLTAFDAALVRIDLPAGETLSEPPAGARVSTLSGQSSEAAFIGPAPNVDPQLQGRGFFFLMKIDSLRLAPGQAVFGFLKLPGERLSGVVVPREAVVRNEGEAWVYIRTSGSNAFTRVAVTLDHPTDAGWFVTNGAVASDRLVVAGAQQLLSFELKGAGAEE
jgi:hypothetical protein